MKIITTLDQLSQVRSEHTHMQALVPTMGALHDGHRALIKKARDLVGAEGTVTLSLFVNPTQFDNAQDLEKYPRTMDADLEICKQDGVDLVFAPDPEQLYHADSSIKVIESSLSSQLCGATRPGHFDGVCTIVLKLFNIIQADIAVFGQKDYQQLAIIRRMVRDLNVPISIIGVETVREPSGLALSSRNARLDSNQRQDAARIYQALTKARDAYENGKTNVQTLVADAKHEILSSNEQVDIDYLDILDAESLQPIQKVESPALMAVAAFYGEVRLIDNIELS